MKRTIGLLLLATGTAIFVCSVRAAHKATKRSLESLERFIKECAKMEKHLIKFSELENCGEEKKPIEPTPIYIYD